MSFLDGCGGKKFKAGLTHPTAAMIAKSFTSQAKVKVKYIYLVKRKRCNWHRDYSSLKQQKHSPRSVL